MSWDQLMKELRKHGKGTLLIELIGLAIFVTWVESWENKSLRVLNWTAGNQGR